MWIPPSLFKFCSYGIYYSGILHAVNFVSSARSNNFLILTYHRIGNDNNPFAIDTLPVQVFEQQVRYFAKNWHVRSLEEVVHLIQEGQSLPTNCVVITFDDGYQDNYLYAFPILKKYSLPATVFLVSGVIGSTSKLWFDQVLYGFQSTHKKVAWMIGQQFSLRSLVERKQAAFSVLEKLKRLNDAEKNEKIEEVLSALQVKSTMEKTRLMLSWEEVREMQKEGVDFGSHTVSHPILSQISEEKAKAEIVLSKQAIEQELQREVTTFAYPNGSVLDYTNYTIQAVKEAGYACAVTTQWECNGYGQDLFQLKRLRPWDTELPPFACRLSLWRFLSHTS